MRRTALTALLFLPSLTWGYTYSKDKVDLTALEKQLRAAGFAVEYSRCSGPNCETIFAPEESKDPSTIIENYVYVDPAIAVNAARAQAVALAKKLKAGTITAAEKDALLLRLCFLLLSQEQG